MAKTIEKNDEFQKQKNNSDCENITHDIDYYSGV